MIRRCEGQDKELTLDIAVATGQALGGFTKVGNGYVPCKCGLVFDDLQQSIVHPHRAVGGRARMQRDGKPGWKTSEV